MKCEDFVKVAEEVLDSHRSLTTRSLGNVEVTIVDSLHHSQFAFLQIDVSPTQRQQFANDLRNALAL